MLITEFLKIVILNFGFHHISLQLILLALTTKQYLFHDTERGSFIPTALREAQEAD